MANLAKQIKLPAKTTFDKIYKYYAVGGDSVKLSEKEHQIRKRWQVAFSLLCNISEKGETRSVEAVKNTLVETEGISAPQAYRDIKNAMRLFGDVLSATRKGQRHVIYEMQMRVYNLALREGSEDLTAANRAIGNMINLFNLNFPDSANKDEDIQPHTYKMSIPKEIITMLSSLTKSGVVNLNDTLPAEDVLFEEVKDGDKKA